MKLYNTLSGKTEPFSPAEDGVVKMYVCGVTPYAPSHVGHALRAVVFDVLRRYLEYTGLKVRHVENFTDIDDKMIQGAAQTGVSVDELAEQNIGMYLEEMDAMNVLRAQHYPRATHEIDRIVTLIQGLEEKGYGYAANGSVYFRVRRDVGYGKLSRRDLDSMMAGARVEVDEAKEDPMDFALWKAQKPGEPCWDSPWGPGRPGWHIECSAMAMTYLSQTVDIHGGGQDLIFPHHENEIAQSEAYSGVRPFAGFWIHNALLQLGDDKMSKSLGNLVTAADALQRFSSDAMRLFFLGSHYRSPLAYSDEAILAQERAAERLRNALSTSRDESGATTLDATPHKRRFDEAMDADLNTPQAIAVLFDLARDINRGRDERTAVGAAQDTLKTLAGVLGLTLSSTEQDSTADVAPLVNLLIQTRTELRTAKQYEAADRIRDRLAELGYQLEDTADGTEWKRGAGR